MTVLRRLDCVLAPTKQKVLDYLPKVEKLSDSAKSLRSLAKIKADILNLEGETKELEKKVLA